MSKLYTEEEIVEKIRAMVESASLATVADKFGIQPPFICDVLAGRKRLGKTMPAALGLRKVVRYKPIA